VPKINVYLPDDLADAVREASVPVSAVCQRALEQAVRRVTALRELPEAGLDPDAAAEASPFTRRAMAVLAAAEASARRAHSPVQTEDVLAALIKGDNMAVRVLRSMDITPGRVLAELARRQTAGRALTPDTEHDAEPAGERARLSPQLATVLEHAGNESSALGNGFVGCEHLLLGLIAEPDGTGGSVLRSLGAELRLTRRTVSGALAGWYAAVARGQHDAAAAAATEHNRPPAQEAATAATVTAVSAGESGMGQLATSLSAAIRAELAPVLARVERLEGLAAD